MKRFDIDERFTAQVVEESSDGERLERLVRELLVGQPFLFPQFGFGDEVTLHFGAQGEFGHPLLKGLPRGAFSLGICASSWRFESPVEEFCDGYILNDADPDAAAKRFEEWSAAFAGLEVSDLRLLHRPQSMLLRISLAGDGRTPGFILVTPRSDAADDEHPIPDWELFTPYERLLSVGPGPRWSYTVAKPFQGRRGS